MPTDPQPPNEDDPMNEELTLSQISQEFKIARPTLNYWVRIGALPARKEHSELGQPYYLVKRGEVSKTIASRPNTGRKRKPPKTAY